MYIYIERFYKRDPATYCNNKGIDCNSQKKYVPQGEKPLRAIKALLPKLKSVQDRGGVVFKIGDFFSEEYSDAVCEKYINLWLLFK